MIRITRRLALVALLLMLAPLSAYAQSNQIVRVERVTSSGGDLGLVKNNDILTIDLVISNDSLATVAGIGLDVTGYDTDANGIADNGLVFLGGTAADVVFADTSIPGVGSIGGLPNIRGASAEGVVEKGQIELPPQCNPTICIPEGQPAIELHAVYVEAVDPFGATGDGSQDLGIGGDLIANGDIHAQVMFLATTDMLTERTDITLVFGPSLALGNDVIDPDGNSIPFMGDTLSFTLIPEPGTALLFGLGLAGLGSIRRR